MKLVQSRKEKLGTSEEEEKKIKALFKKEAQKALPVVLRDFDEKAIISCYDCRKRILYKDSSQKTLPHLYCKECGKLHEEAMQAGLNRLSLKERRIYTPYIRAGIIGWYDVDWKYREIHDYEMFLYRQGLMQVIEALKGADKETKWKILSQYMYETRFKEQGSKAPELAAKAIETYKFLKNRELPSSIRKLRRKERERK